MAAAIRLARFNITRRRAKRYFIGLPSPAAGMTLRRLSFTTTELYQHVFRFLPRHHLMQLLMILLTILMVSNVRYATFPRRRAQREGLLGLATLLFMVIFGILEHDAFFFPWGSPTWSTGSCARRCWLLLRGGRRGNRHRGPIVIADNGAVPRCSARRHA